MSLADHGGFDLSLEVTEELLSAAIVGLAPIPLPPDQDVTLPDMVLRVHTTAITPTALDVTPGEVVLIRGDFHATATVLQASLNGFPVTLPPGLSGVTLQGRFSVPAAVGIGAVGGTPGVVLTPSAPSGTATVDANAVFASPPVQLILASAYISGGEAAYLLRHQQIEASVDALATGAVRSAAGALAPVLALAQPAGLTLAAARTTNLTLKILARRLRPPGNPALATATTVRRDALGAPLDHVGLVVNNATILGAVPPALATPLGVPATSPPWFPGHPCLLVAGAPLVPPGFVMPTVPGGMPAATLSLDFVHGFVNAGGLLQLDVRLKVVAWGSLATLTTSATLTAPFTAAVAGGVLTFGLGAPSIVTSSDVSINPWLYAMGALTGGGPVLAILSVIDLFAGPFLDIALRGALGGLTGGLLPGFTLPLAGPFAALTVDQLVSVEPAAPSRTVTLAGLTFTLDRAQDVTVRLA